MVFSVITGHSCTDEEINLENYAKVDTLIILMGVKKKQFIASKLIECGRSPEEPVAFIENAARKIEKVQISTLKNVAENKTDVSPPAVWIIGNVVRYYDKFNS